MSNLEEYGPTILASIKRDQQASCQHINHGCLDCGVALARSPAPDTALREALALLNAFRRPPEYPGNGERWAGWVEGYDAARSIVALADQKEPR